MREGSKLSVVISGSNVSRTRCSAPKLGRKMRRKNVQVWQCSERNEQYQMQAMDTRESMLQASSKDRGALTTSEDPQKLLSQASLKPDLLCLETFLVVLCCSRSGVALPLSSLNRFLRDFSTKDVP